MITLKLKDLKTSTTKAKAAERSYTRVKASQEILTHLFEDALFCSVCIIKIHFHNSDEEISIGGYHLSLHYAEILFDS